MENNFVAKRLDLRAFAQASGFLRGDERLECFSRLVAETQGAQVDAQVTYSARGELRYEGQPREQVWLHLNVSTLLSLTCQRCLGEVRVPMSIERSFRFVDNEVLAAALDEEAEEDVLVLDAEFNLLELVEDELLLDLPVVPKHDACPVQVNTQVVDAHFFDESAARPNPFAALDRLKKTPSSPAS